MGHLDGRVAVVTGASRGIGKEIALLFAKEGAKVVVAARTENEGDHQLAGAITETVNEAKAAGGEATAVRADISQLGDIEHLVATARNTYGPIDILVNNAALTYYTPVADFQQRRLQRMFDVDVFAPFMLAQAVIPDMIGKGRGNIVNISSLAARHPEGPPYDMAFRGGTVYGMVKASLERFTTGLAQELYDKNIAVNALSPFGIVASPGVLFHKLIKDDTDPRAEPVDYMARAALILAACTPQEQTGGILYSQPVLKKHGQL
jgi:citronellol/citronellal dehydrogenase